MIQCLNGIDKTYIEEETHMEAILKMLTNFSDKVSTLMFLCMYNKTAAKSPLRRHTLTVETSLPRIASLNLHILEICNSRKTQTNEVILADK